MLRISWRSVMWAALAVLVILLLAEWTANVWYLAQWSGSPYVVTWETALSLIVPLPAEFVVSAFGLRRVARRDAAGVLPQALMLAWICAGIDSVLWLAARVPGM